MVVNLHPRTIAEVVRDTTGDLIRPGALDKAADLLSLSRVEMTDNVTTQKPNALRAIMGQMSCWRCHAPEGNVEENG
jgi:hypothetical protein